MERDRELDNYRALLMAYMVCVIHLFYFFEYGSEPLRSYALVEMPAVFFISGAAHSLSAPKSYGKFLWSKVKRILVPYYIWVVISLLLVQLPWPEEAMHFAGCTEPVTWSGIADMLLLKEVKCMPYRWHIWFILPFMTIMALAPWLYARLHNERAIWTTVVLTGVAILLMDVLRSTTGWDTFFARQCRHVIVYLSFFVLGFLYKRVALRSIHLWMGLAFAALLFGLIYTGIYPVSMQQNKFPPDFAFWLFGHVGLLLLCLFFQRVKLPNWKWLVAYNQRGMTIYLYQNWIYIGLLSLCIAVGVRFSWINFGWLLLVIFWCLRGSSWVMIKLEDAIIHRLDRIVLKQQ